MSKRLPSTLSGASDFGLPALNKEANFYIDLAGTRLCFSTPKRGLDNAAFSRGHPADMRPVVNTLSKSDYRINPLSHRMHCILFETGWPLYTQKWLQKKHHGVLKFAVSLQSPARAEYTQYPNLFDESCLKKWLALYYSERVARVNSVSFKTLEDGTLALQFADAADMQIVAPEDVPLKKHPKPLSGLPCYFVYLERGLIEFNLPIARHDVLQLSFSLKSITEDPPIRDQLKHASLTFIQCLLDTLCIELSDLQTTYATSAPGITQHQYTQQIRKRK